MKILICGDTVPTSSNFGLFSSGNTEELFGRELLTLFQEADYRITNLEVPLIDSLHPIPKCGPNLITPTSTIRGLKELEIDLFSLANNHILDQGDEGLYSTIETLKANEIDWLGAGANITEASVPKIIDCDGIKVGIYACCEHEFTIATEDTPGANPYDPLITFDEILALKEKCDHVIVLFHGGKEHYRYPSPKVQKLCRKMVEKGASLVICQHSHCIGCEEQYNNGRIVYGQGNFIFDHSESEFWKTSLLVQCEVTKEELTISYYPIVKKQHLIRLASSKEQAEIISAFQKRTKEIIDPVFIAKKYEEFAQDSFQKYVLQFWGILNCRPLRLLMRLTGYRLFNCLFAKKNLLAMQNFLECEAHHELFLTAIMAKYNEK